MSLFLRLRFMFFTCNLLSMFIQDWPSFLLMPEEYDRKLIFGNSKLGLSFIGDISYFYSSKPSLLAKSCNTFQYVQQIYDLVLGYSVEDYLLAKVDLRSRILWGSNQDLVISNSLNFLGAEYGDHNHDIENKNFFWLREGWVNLDLSRFMGLTRSSNLTIGKIPYMVGRGISYGVVYSELPGLIGANAGSIIESFAPAVLLSMELYSNNNHTVFGDLYCAILENYSGSIEQNMAPIYEKRIWHCPDKAERGFGHINTAMVAQLKYETVNKYGLLQVQPYVLCNLSPEVSVNIARSSFADYVWTNTTTSTNVFNFDDNEKTKKKLNSGKLITLGCMINWISDRFCFNFEWAINKGGFKIYGQDHNHYIVKNDYLTVEPDLSIKQAGLTINNSDVIIEPYIIDLDEQSLVNKENQKIIDSSPKTPEWNGLPIYYREDPRYILFNTFTRFNNPKKIDFEGAMAILDFAYYLKNNFVIAATAGFATGGGIDLDQSSFERRFDPALFYLDGVFKPDLDLYGSYGGFISLQELYTGLWVKSAFGLGGPFIRPNRSNFLDYNASNQDFIFKELFTDLKFLGFSLNFFPNDKISIQSNFLYYWSFCNSFQGLKYLDDKYGFPSGFLPKELGLETFIIALFDLNGINAFLGYAVFFPGARYYSPILNPVDFFDAVSFLSTCSFDYDTITKDGNFCGNTFSPDTTKYNPVYLFNAGLYIYF